MKYLIILLLLSSAQLYAQTNEQQLTNYMDAFRANNTLVFPSTLMNPGDTSFLNNLKPYLNDSLEVIRAKSYELTKLAGLASENLSHRQKVVDIITNGIGDSSSGIIGLVTASLTEFDKADFTDKSKQILVDHIELDQPHLSTLVKLAGYLNLVESKEKIQRIKNYSKDFGTRLASQLALARMRDEAAVAYLSEKLQGATINDDFVYDVVPDIIYTRNKELFGILENVIFSNIPNCQTADPDNDEPILCGYRVMEYMLPVLESSPIPLDEFGEIEMTDYKEALMIFRNWLSTNRGNYKVKDNSF